MIRKNRRSAARAMWKYLDKPLSWRLYWRKQSMMGSRHVPLGRARYDA